MAACTMQLVLPQPPLDSHQDPLPIAAVQPSKLFSLKASQAPLVFRTAADHVRVSHRSATPSPLVLTRVSPSLAQVTEVTCRMSVVVSVATVSRLHAFVTRVDPSLLKHATMSMDAAGLTSRPRLKQQ